jgi:hypothetical protein
VLLSAVVEPVVTYFFELSVHAVSLHLRTALTGSMVCTMIELELDWSTVFFYCRFFTVWRSAYVIM